MEPTTSTQGDDREAFKADLERGCRTLGDFLRTQFGDEAGDVLRLFVKAEAGYYSPAADRWLGPASEDPARQMGAAVPGSLVLELGPYLDRLSPEGDRELGEATLELNMACIQWAKFTGRDLGDWTREVIYEVGERVAREFDSS
jgi:hypothetical protein